MIDEFSVVTFLEENCLNLICCWYILVSSHTYMGDVAHVPLFYIWHCNFLT